MYLIIQLQDQKRGVQSKEIGLYKVYFLIMYYLTENKKKNTRLKLYTGKRVL